MYLLDKYQYIVGNYISCVFHGLAPRPAGAAGQVRRLTDSGDPVVFFHTLSVLKVLVLLLWLRLYRSQQKNSRKASTICCGKSALVLADNSSCPAPAMPSSMCR